MDQASRMTLGVALRAATSWEQVLLGQRSAHAVGIDWFGAMVHLPFEAESGARNLDNPREFGHFATHLH